jgi:hypothetical protein
LEECKLGLFQINAEVVIESPVSGKVSGLFFLGKIVTKMKIFLGGDLHQNECLALL